jgi:hypothetical protein
MSPSKTQGSPHFSVARAVMPAASAIVPTFPTAIVSTRSALGATKACEALVLPCLIALLVSALCTASAGQPPAGEPPSASAGQPAQAVVDDYINALGGREALQRIRNRRADGVVEGARRGFSRRNFRLYWAVPNLARVEFKEEGLVTYEGYDGAKGWTQEVFGIAEELKPDALEALLNFADPIRYTRLLEIYPNAAIETDSPEAAGRTTLRATARGDSFRFFFDPKTHLLAEFQKEGDADESAARRYRFEEYRRVDGILFPFTIHVITPVPNLDPAAIRIENVIRYKTVSHNVTIPATLFTRPK